MSENESGKPQEQSEETAIYSVSMESLRDYFVQSHSIYAEDLSSEDIKFLLDSAFSIGLGAMNVYQEGFQQGVANGFQNGFAAAQRQMMMQQQARAKQAQGEKPDGGDVSPNAATAKPVEDEKPHGLYL